MNLWRNCAYVFMIFELIGIVLAGASTGSVRANLQAFALICVASSLFCFVQSFGGLQNLIKILASLFDDPFKM